MYTPEQIINRGLTHIGAKHITSLSRPTTYLERLITEGWPTWVREELSQRRWGFSHEYEYALAQTAYDASSEYPYTFEIPPTALTVHKTKGADWRRTIHGIQAKTPTLKVEVTWITEPDKWPPLFASVMEWRTAVSMVSVRTQSNSKMQMALDGYENAIRIAGRQNAYERLADDYLPTSENDFDERGFTWLTDRY